MKLLCPCLGCHKTPSLLAQLHIVLDCSNGSTQVHLQKARPDWEDIQTADASDIVYVTQKAIKGQVIADQLAKTKAMT